MLSNNFVFGNSCYNSIIVPGVPALVCKAMISRLIHFYLKKCNVSWSLTVMEYSKSEDMF